MTNLYKFTDKYTIGIDEVGRGTLFGNVVACGVIIPETFPDDIYLQIKDSKKLSKKKREFLSNYIKTNAICYSICEITPEEIDKINILQASLKAMSNCVYNIMKNNKINKIIVDGNHFNPIMNNDEDKIIEIECIPKADNIYLAVACASILAKVYHDNQIIKLLEEEPDLNKYDLKNNMGYATLKHRKAIELYGIHKLHRKSFRSCKEQINK
jgi:ribonuclease HII